MGVHFNEDFLAGCGVGAGATFVVLWIALRVFIGRNRAFARAAFETAELIRESRKVPP